MSTASARSRWEGLDTLRGVTLVSMIAYHACWDMVYLFGADWAWYRSDGAYLWQQSICWTFILLSGYCWNLGRCHLKRGLLVFGGGALVSAVTMVVMPGDSIFFGVLSLLGAMMLLLIPLDRLLRPVPARAGLVGSFGLFLLFREVNDGYLGFEGARLLALPGTWYRNYLTACLGFPFAGFRSTDYFPLLPWGFLFLTGYFLFRLRREEPPRLTLPGLTALGRHSLLVYMLHQPVVYGVLWAVHALAG